MISLYLTDALLCLHGLTLYNVGRVQLCEILQLFVVMRHLGRLYFDVVCWLL